MSSLKVTKSAGVTRLNPCYDGRCSMSRQNRKRGTGAQYVLILVLMEYALRVDLVFLVID